ncbi:MAG: endonuclease V [Promethearchaeota archaeon]
MIKKHELLREDYSFEQAKLLQLKYQNIIKKNHLNKKLSNINDINIIAGVDISYYVRKDNEYGVACAVEWNILKEEMESSCFSHDIIKFPYKPGFLGFRESKLLAKAILKLPTKPDVVMCDGHGKIHPRRFGEASHLGLALKIPSIGVAKNPFIGFSNSNKIERFKGNKTPIWAKDPKLIINIDSKELLGYEVCLNDYSKPIFISEGYKITLDTAVKVCLNTAKGHRQPEPLYLADYLSRNERNKYLS